MYCKYCGKELSDTARFCPSCGRMVEEESIYSDVEVIGGQVIHKDPKVWQIFAKIGFVFGIINICLCWIPLLNLSLLGIPGIVFGALGKKSKYYYGKASTGFILSLVGTILSFVAYIVVIIIAIAEGGSIENYYQ